MVVGVELLGAEITDSLTKATSLLNSHIQDHADGADTSLLWDKEQRRLLLDVALDEASRERYSKLFDLKIEDPKHMYEFYTKLFILEPNFRKFLANEPVRVKDLLVTGRVERPFLKCIDVFFGLQFFGIENSGAYKPLYAFLEGCSNDPEFDHPSLPLLPPPFNRFPNANPGYLFELKKKEIKPLKAELDTKIAIELALKNQIASLQSSVSNLTLKCDGLTEKCNRFTEEKNVLLKDIEAKKAALVAANRLLESVKQVCRVVDRPKPQVNPLKDDCVIRIHALNSKNELEYITPKEFTLVFDPPENNLQVREVIDPKTGVYDIVLIKKIGQFQLKKILADGREVDGSQFSFNLMRDYKAIGSGEVLPVAFQGVWGLCVDENDSVYVVDTDSHNVQIFNTQRELTRTLVCQKLGDALPYPRGIAVRNGGEIAVVCNNHHKVHIYKSGANAVDMIGERGNEANQLFKPRGICVGPDGELVIVDSDNHRIQFVDKSGAFRSVGSKGTKPDQFFYPASVARFKDHIVVSDCDNHRIVLMKCDGTQAKTFGTKGDKDGELSRPTGIAVDPLGNIIVADMSNNRVQVFDSQGKYLTKIGQNELKEPRGLAVDSLGRIFVADFGNKRVMIF